MKYILVHASSGKVFLIIVLVLGLVEVNSTIFFFHVRHILLHPKKFFLVLFDQKGRLP